MEVQVYLQIHTHGLSYKHYIYCILSYKHFIRFNDIWIICMYVLFYI